HAANMRQRFAQQKIAWPEITGQDLADLLVYLRNLPATRLSASRLDTEGPGNGRELFQSKGCAGCHTGKLELAPRLRGKTRPDIAADMWDPAPKMRNPPPALETGEMRQIVVHLWSEQVFRESGSAAVGRKVFVARSCAVCHDDRSSGAPDLAGRKGSYSSVSMMSTLWRHGPRMLDQMKARNIAWPQFTARQMTDLIAYLNTK